MKARLLNLAKVVVTVGLLAVVLLSVDLREVWQQLAGADVAALLGAFLLYQAGIIIRSYRWQALLGAQGAAVPLGRLVTLYYVGTFFNSFLPSGFGGDVVKMYELSRSGASGATSVSTVLADRILGLLVLLAMALLALPFSWRLVPPTVVMALLALMVGAALGLGLLLNRRLVEALAARVALLRRLLAHPKIAAFYATFHHYDRRSLLAATGASLAFNLSLIAVQMLLARAVGVRLGAQYFFLFVPILSSLLALPISISGFGVREGGYVVLFGGVGVASGQAVAMSVLSYILNLATGIVGGVLYLWQGAAGYRRQKA